MSANEVAGSYLWVRCLSHVDMLCLRSHFYWAYLDAPALTRFKRNPTPSPFFLSLSLSVRDGGLRRGDDENQRRSGRGRWCPPSDRDRGWPLRL